MMGWRAHLVDEWGTQGHRLYVVRENGEYLESLNGDGTVSILRASEAGDSAEGLLLPRGAWEAIVELAAPHADAGAVDELRRALERAEGRVDRVFDHVLGDLGSGR